MIRFLAGSFVAAFFGVELLQSSAFQVLDEDGNEDAAKVAQWREIAAKGLRHMASECLATGFGGLAGECERLEAKLNSTAMNPTLHLLRALLENIGAELHNHLYFWVPGDRKDWYHDDDKPLFGEAVAIVISGSTEEIAEAGRCLALGRWTAAVFHLMRATELALHKWAVDLQVPLKHPAEQSNWQDILNAADQRLKAIEQQPKSAERDADLEYFGETSAHFRAVKDAWRNHVAHAKKTYDERKALSIAEHVRAFMDMLASRPSVPVS